MSTQVLHVRLILEECFGVLGQQGQIVILREPKETVSSVASLLGWLCVLAGVDETVDVRGHLLVPLEVSQAVHQLRKDGEGEGEEE